MTRDLVFTPDAIADLEEVFEFIAADNPHRARSYVEEIRQACRDLCASPMIGRERPDIRPGLRYLPLWRRIIIAYELQPGRLDVVRILSGGQDYATILGSD